MDISEFTSRLLSALTDRGISSDDASEYVQNLKKHLDPEDVFGTDDAEIEKMADVCADMMKKSGNRSEKEDSSDKAVSFSADTDNINNDDPVLSEMAELRDDAAVEIIDESFSSISDTEFISDIGTDTDVAYVPADDPVPDSDPVSDINFSPETQFKDKKATRRSLIMLILITAALSPLWVIAAAVFLAPFIIMYVGEIALTVGLICLLAGAVAAGSAASLTGIIYGIVKMFSSVSVGLYEIGFGIIIVGVTMICGILIYNASVRFMPWLFKKTGVLFDIAFAKARIFLAEYKRRCEKL